MISCDSVNSDQQNLLDREVQAEVLALLDSGLMFGVGAAPVCASMSDKGDHSWRRTAEFPCELPHCNQDQQRKLHEESKFASFVGHICRWAHCLHCSSWAENPATSFIWWLEEVVSDLNM